MNVVENQSTTRELADLVRRHKMRWHVRLEHAVAGGELVQIGFVVELTAEPDAPAHPPSPGCEECAPVERALERVARAVLPRGPHASWYDVDVIAGQLEFDPAHGLKPRLAATITILHRGEINRPPDECERACRDEIRDHLIALGARED